MTKGVKKTLTKNLTFRKLKKKLTVNEELKIQLKKNLLEATDVKNKIFSVSSIILRIKKYFSAFDASEPWRPTFSQRHLARGCVASNGEIGKQTKRTVQCHCV